MRQKVSGEDARIQTAIAEREAQKAADEAEKEQKRATMLQSIKEHRIEQVEFQRDFYWALYTERWETEQLEK